MIWIIILYLIPVIVTYLFKRKELNQYNRSPNFEDFAEVFCPIINIVIMIRDIHHNEDYSKTFNWIIKKLFLIK